MSDIQSTEADKREAVEIARLLGAGAGIFDIGLGTRVGQTAERIARIRADAVKSDRGLLREAFLGLEYDHVRNERDAGYNSAIGDVLDILSCESRPHG